MEPVELTDETMTTPEGICWHFLVSWPSLIGHTSDPVAAANAAATIRLADAAERMADRLEDIDHTLTAISRVGLDDDLNLTCMPLDDLVRRRQGVDAILRTAAQAEAPDMSEALEAEYQRGRADAVKVMRQRTENYQNSAADWTESAKALEELGDASRARYERQVAETRYAAASALQYTANLIEAGEQ